MLPKKLIFIIMLTACALQAQSKPVVKSLVLPGWGESTFGETKRSHIFYTVEATLWTSAIISRLFSMYYLDTSKAYASEYAGVEQAGKHNKFWIDIGNYDSRALYNDEHLRWRDFENLYNESNDWNWTSSNARKHFDEMRIRGDKWNLALQFLGAGLVLNRVVSAIDVIYLVKRNDESLSFLPVISQNSIKYSLIYRF